MRWKTDTEADSASFSASLMGPEGGSEEVKGNYRFCGSNGAAELCT